MPTTPRAAVGVAKEEIEDYWGHGILRSCRQEKPPSHLAHGRNELVACVFYEFMAPHLSVATEGYDETYNQTAFQFTIDRSKNDAAPEAERGTRWMTSPR